MKFLISLNLTLLFCLFFSGFVSATTVSGRSSAGLNFTITTVTKSGAAKDGFYEDLIVKYRPSSGALEKTYIYKAQAPAVLSINRFGLVTLGEKIGGMDGSYSATYLLPTEDSLKNVGGVEVSMTNGRYLQPLLKANVWGESVSVDERNRLVNMIAERSNELTGAEDTSINDVLLLFAVPEIMEKIQKENTEFARQYSRAIIEKTDSSLGNSIRRVFVGKNTGLCSGEQFEIFSCRVDTNVVSVCLTWENENIEYRYGRTNNLSLRITRNFNKAKDDKGEIYFSNKDYQYIVLNHDASLDASIVIRKNGMAFARKKCDPDNSEPILFPTR